MDYSQKSHLRPKWIALKSTLSETTFHMKIPKHALIKNCIVLLNDHPLLCSCFIKLGTILHETIDAR